MARTILLIGATGMVGRLTAQRLAGEGHGLHLLARRPTGMATAETIAPSEDWPDLVRSLGGDVAICAIGTTMRKARSEVAFRAVDLDLALDFASAARTAGIAHMIAISSVGADVRSRNFYLRTKGEMEAGLEMLGFARLDILRPGLLRGERGSDRRPGERLAILISPLVNLVLRGRLHRYTAIDARIVAAAIHSLVEAGGHGAFIHHNRDLHRLAAA